MNVFVSQNNDLIQTAQHLKTMTYAYDLVSGNTNRVNYQPGKYDEWYHKYCYDNDNRLTQVLTSKDGHVWESDAKYFYYAHGALARTEHGDQTVQACDYMYTLQGWLKGVNSDTRQVLRDPGRDGGNGINKFGGRDVMGFSLGFFDGDYKTVNAANTPGTTTAAIADAETNSPLNSRNLYNGNIRHMVTTITDSDPTSNTYMDALPQGMVYKYDQLNRIKEAESVQGVNVANNTWSGTATNTNYHTLYTFDGNGNLQTLTREGVGSTMDRFIYNYLTDANGKPTNQLGHVDDLLSLSGNYTTDIDDQDIGNYTYDEIGQLTADADEEIKEIKWNVRNKVREIIRDDNSELPDLEFIYDATGMRLCKIVKPKATGGALLAQTAWKYTYYSYDASGNPIVVYDRKTIGQVGGGANDYVDILTAEEQYIFGSNRHGVYNNGASYTVHFTGTINTGETEIISRVYDTPHADDADHSSTETGVSAEYMQTPGSKVYELSNHLGNVLNTVSDRRIAVDDGIGNLVYYDADVVSHSDYYPYGVVMPGRSYVNVEKYRYGFQGMETDGETVGDDNLHTTYFRLYNTRLARWNSVDPYAYLYPGHNPYKAFLNNPNIYTDPTGGSEDSWEINLHSGEVTWINDAGGDQIQYFQFVSIGEDGLKYYHTQRTKILEVGRDEWYLGAYRTSHMFYSKDYEPNLIFTVSNFNFWEGLGEDYYLNNFYYYDIDDLEMRYWLRKESAYCIKVGLYLNESSGSFVPLTSENHYEFYGEKMGNFIVGMVYVQNAEGLAGPGHSKGVSGPRRFNYSGGAGGSPFKLKSYSKGTVFSGVYDPKGGKVKLAQSFDGSRSNTPNGQVPRRGGHAIVKSTNNMSDNSVGFTVRLKSPNHLEVISWRSRSVNARYHGGNELKSKSFRRQIKKSLKQQYGVGRISINLDN